MALVIRAPARRSPNLKQAKQYEKCSHAEFYALRLAIRRQFRSKQAETLEDAETYEELTSLSEEEKRNIRKDIEEAEIALGCPLIMEGDTDEEENP